MKADIMRFVILKGITWMAQILKIWHNQLWIQSQMGYSIESTVISSGRLVMVRIYCLMLYSVVKFYIIILVVVHICIYHIRK